MEPKNIFVYGTLKKGYANEHCMGNSEFLGEHWTSPGFLVYGLGFAPAMCRDPKSEGRVKGELYRVTDPSVMQLLDQIEGVARGVYTREEIELNDGTVTETYLQPFERLDGYGRFEPEPDGIWTGRREYGSYE